jgi:hypothetical protein
MAETAITKVKILRLPRPKASRQQRKFVNSSHQTVKIYRCRDFAHATISRFTRCKVPMPTPQIFAVLSVLAVMAYSQSRSDSATSSVSHAGIARARSKGTQSGKPIGRPWLDKRKEAAVRAELGRGTGIQTD